MFQLWIQVLQIFIGGGHNFERPNVELPIFRNLKIANVKAYGSSIFWTNLFYHFEIII